VRKPEGAFLYLALKEWEKEKESNGGKRKKIAI